MRSIRKVLLIGILSVGIATNTFSDEPEHKNANDDVVISLYDFSNQQYLYTFKNKTTGLPSAQGFSPTKVTPVIILDPIAYGGPEEYTNRTTIQKLNFEQISIRVSGSVFDVLSDGIADKKGDIGYIMIWADSLLGNITQRVSVTPISAPNQKAVTPHPQQEFLNAQPEIAKLLRPFAFAGRFQSEEIVIDVAHFYNQSLSVSASNASNEMGFANIDLSYKVNASKTDFEVIAETEDNSEFLYSPIFVHIKDRSITQSNVNNGSATINGEEAGLRFIDGQLQLDRPLFGVYMQPKKNIPNIVQVKGEPDSIKIEYEGQSVELSWGYTE